MDKNNEFNQGLKLIAKSSLIVFIGILFSKVFTYLYRIVIAREFGPEVYGLFSLAIMVSGWFVAIFSFGITEGMVKFIPAYRKNNNQLSYLFKYSMKFLIVSSLVSSIALFFFAKTISEGIFNETGLVIYLQSFSLLIPLWIFSNFFLSVLRGFEYIGWYSFILNFLQNFIKLASIVLLILISVKSNVIIVSYSLGFVAMFILSLWILRIKEGEIFKKINVKENFSKLRGELWSYSWPMLFSGVIASLFYWLDTFAIGYFMDSGEVGIYNAAIPISLLLFILPELFVQIFLPLINREYSKGNNEVVNELSKQVGKWIFLLNIPLLIILFLFPGVIINILFGPDYLFAALPLKILSIGFFFSSIFFVSQNLILMKGKSKWILLDLVVISLFNLILNLLLIPKYGIVGAAISTTICWVILGMIWAIQSYYLTGIIPLRKKIFTIILSSILPLILVFYLREKIDVNLITLSLTGILFLIIYFLLIIITKSLDKNDLLIIRTVKEKLNFLS